MSFASIKHHSITRSPSQYHPPIGASRISFSPHSRDRALERLSISSERELRTLAANARNKGISLHGVNLNNYARLNLSYREFASFKRSCCNTSKSERVYLYKDYIYVFRGKDATTLITVFKLKLFNDIPEYKE